MKISTDEFIDVLIGIISSLFPFVRVESYAQQGHGNISLAYVRIERSPFPVYLLISHTDVYNKIDAISLEQMDKLARSAHTVVISCEMDLKYVPVPLSHPMMVLTPFQV